jgi:hypothetical protein
MTEMIIIRKSLCRARRKGYVFLPITSFLVPAMWPKTLTMPGRAPNRRKAALMLAACDNQR